MKEKNEKDILENVKWENGVRINWDNQGNMFVTMPVNSIPKKKFDEWMKECNSEYSGKRWDMIMADHIKAKAYSALLMTIPEEENMPEDTNINPDGLLNGGTDNGK